MRLIRVLLMLAVIQFFIAQGEVYSEIIYTNEGDKIQGKITEITEDTIWVETTEGDITEYIGVEKSAVEKILNDDGSKYSYSPAKKDEVEGE